MSADIYKLLFFTSIIVWLLPPFKQFRGKYFFFFLILAFMDPTNLIFLFIIKSSLLQSQVSIFLTYFLFLSVIEKNLLKKYWILFVVIFFGLLSPIIFQLNGNEILFIYIFLQLGITSIILKNLITNYVSATKLSVFLLVFLFYQLTTLTKLSNLLFGFADAFAFFILTTIVQILFGLYFSVFTEDNKTGDTV